MSNERLSDRFFQRGREFLGGRYPILSGAMTWISDAKLVSAVCNAGGFGCLASGRMCAHLLLMGASGVQLGTRFAVAAESCAHPAFKEHFLRANARDAVSTPQFDSRLPVVAVRALRNQGHEDFARLQLELIGKLDRHEVSREEAQLEVEKFWMGALRRAVQEGDVRRGSLMAGQSVGLVDRVQPVADIIRELADDMEAEFRRVRQALQ